ncbi:MAG: hypothetical protein EOM12_14640 [Verrucomicrobiae bacterium]|nr:hypothetical protein [Verrucomicrobiae bacterium]
MDLIANAAIQPAWLENLGKEQVVFEGRGGTGKTMILLGLAWKLQNEQAARVLVLTYNNALVSDLRRLLALMGRVDDWGRPMIEVHTIYSILSRFFSAVGLIQQDDSDYYNNYEKYKKEALDFYKQNALTQDDYNEAIEASPSFLSWDYVFIDEGQDWPQDEKELLHTIYSPSRFVVADGCDQLVRRDEKCDWSATVNCKTTRIGLSKGLRMKSNLARFANSLAQSLALDSWSIENNPDSVGGRTVIVEGNPESLSGELKKLVSEAKRSGNAAIDLLTCVPPQLVISGHALVADWYAEWGYSVWDGTSETTRRTLPKSVEDMRIVQYDSCRGLEGWSVINFDIDRLYDYKLSWWEKPSDGYPSYADEDALAKRYAARWLMIPTTRAIDTLVLHIRSRSSYIGGKLWSLYNAYGDIIEWIKV